MFTIARVDADAALDATDYTPAGASTRISTWAVADGVSGTLARETITPSAPLRYLHRPMDRQLNGRR